ncbi:hypothetical protein [Enterocloster bolteae]|uniref:hypothetical protein n=1 Tax=Enterocloster bolteae TaxID=208479 RepID=UPI00189D2D7F|nr:hypothetical protein [Enterocloster bolteae]
MTLQATNAGIDYQQRVSAFFLVLMLRNKDMDLFLPGANGKIQWIQLESMEDIDDMVLSNERGNNYYFQIKRKISFQNNPKSEFYKTCIQFVEQYEKGREKTENYYLITSEESSSKVTERLRRLLNHIRVSNSLKIPSLNKEDKRIFDDFTNMIDLIFSQITGGTITRETLLELCRRIYIVTLNVEKEKSDERVALAILQLGKSKDIRYIWETLIAQSLYYATNRMKIKKEFLEKEYGTYLLSKEPKTNNGEPFFNIETESIAQIGYDIILGQSSELLEAMGEEAKLEDYVVLQLYRFDEVGKKNISFYTPPDVLTMPNDLNVNVIQRFSSIKGFQRFMEEKGSTLQKQNIYFFGGQGDGQEDNFPQAQLHKKWVEDIIHSKEFCEQRKCIHCEESVFDSSFIIEIDNINEKLKVGLAHEECVRPVDRILGIVKIPFYQEFSYLNKFDIESWISNLIDGQRCFANLEFRHITLANMLWNDDIESNKKGRFCIKVLLDDGDVTYVKQRGFVYRGPKENILEDTRFMNNSLKNNKEDPFAYIKNTWESGNYSMLKNRVEISEEIVLCKSYECVQYTSEIRELFDIKGNYYAPLVFISIDDEIVLIDGYLFLMTNPFDLDKYLKNWKKHLGIDFTEVEYEVSGVYSDQEMDQLMKSVFSDGISVIVNPWFGNEKELLRGISISDFNSLC